MGQTLTVMVEYDTDSGSWHVGATSRCDGAWELAASEPCGDTATTAGVRDWIARLYDAWSCPPLTATPSESLHDVFAGHP